MFPQAQTLGTFYAVTKAPDGTVLFDLNGMTLIDIGGGDLHETEVSVRPRYRLAINRPGDGTIRASHGRCGRSFTRRCSTMRWRSTR